MAGEDGRSPALRPEEGGITFREAALRLNVSEKTLRARIKAGEVHAWQIEGKRGPEWRVRLPEGREGEGEGREEGREPPAGGRDLGRDGGGDPSRPSPDLWRDFLTRHEAAVQQLGYFKAQAEQVKMLAASSEEERRKAAAAEERARILAGEKEEAERTAREEHTARRKAEDEAEELRRRVNAAEGALEAERSKGFLARLFNR